MEASDGSPPHSLCMIRAAELFPKSEMEKEDTQLSVSFQELAGESVKYLGRTDDGILALSNYRIFLLKTTTNSETCVPLGLIETAQSRDLFHLIINCKDASTVKCSFETAEQCSEWQRRLQAAVGIPETLESLFAFPFYSWTCDNISNHEGIPNDNSSTAGINSTTIENHAASVCSGTDYSERLQRAYRNDDDFMREVERLGFDLNGPWRVSKANAEFKLCPSYPQKILVPCCISDETLNTVSSFRGSRRLPAVVWRHRKSGAVIARCSQPEVGWLGWRNSKDEQLLKALADACAFDRGEQTRRLLQGVYNQTNLSGESSPSSPDEGHEEVALDEVRKILIVDARSYTSAVTNRARGGGCECIEYYPFAEIEFMNLGNIHVIRKSFNALRQLCASPADVPNWLGLLEKTMWLQHLSGLLAASMTVCHAIEKKGRPVLVHCSDGWDRTPQIVATAQICLDPFYRTVEGFRILVEREWLSYGHKFSDRCGHGPTSDELNERCPVFLQWLDLIHQIHKQYPCSFEFSMGYLIKLAQHSHSCLFGTFFCNTLKERMENSVFERTFSVWPFLSGPIYRNPLYVPKKEKVLWPAHNVRDLYLWTEVYLGSLGNLNGTDFPTSTADVVHGNIGLMSKTRSYGDLISAGIMQSGISRRSSDPNMTVDANLTALHSENNSISDIYSEREDSPDIISNFINDTTRKLENLTIELNNHDKNNFININDEQAKTMNGHEKIPIENFQISLPNHTTHQQQINEITADGTKVIDSSLITSPSQIDVLQPTGCESNVIHPTVINNSIKETSEDILNQNNKLKCSLAITDTKSTDDINFHKGIICPQNDINYDLMKSVELGNQSNNSYNSSNGTGSLNALKLENEDNMWHGSVNTSTDTLVPIESTHLPLNSISTSNESSGINSNRISDHVDDVTDGVNSMFKSNMQLITETKTPELAFSNNSFKPTGQTNTSTSNSILPKIHSSSSRANILSTSYSNVSNSIPSSSVIINSNKNIDNTNLIESNEKSYSNNAQNSDSEVPEKNNIAKSHSLEGPAESMDDSILILPEHPKLEISISGKYERIINNTASPTSTIPTSLNSYGACYAMGPIHRRRRTSSSNSRRDIFNTKPTNGSSVSRFSLNGARSLPMTPPGLSDRPQIAISCPDGLAHALSEQNIRLQQIVHEHKLREDVLLREIHDMRMALLKKICPNCSAVPTANDEQVDEVFNAKLKDNCDLCKCSKVILCAICHKSKHQWCYHHSRRRGYLKNSNEDSSNGDNDCECDDGSSSISVCSGLDNVENASICSWEAVEDRSGPSSCTSSSTQPNATSVLWVPDHAVSRCTSCQTEFWLGRRKHHCRSCGQIFCADCSEFWAPLPDEKLFSPVRLCGPCYHSVTTRLQISHYQNSALLQLQQNASKSITAAATGTAASITAASAVITKIVNNTTITPVAATSKA